jgi:acetate kinase
MANIILSINAGSSSVKCSVQTFDPSSPSSSPKPIAEISIAGLTAPPVSLTYSRGSTSIAKDKKLDNISNAQDAFKAILEHLTSDADLSELKHPDDIAFACHRIVHGGSYAKPTRIDADTYHHLEALSALAPLHNAGALEIVKAVHASIPKATNVAFFDSAFHATIPAATRTYMIDPAKANQNGLRKYGFHGLSYAFIAKSIASYLSKPLNELNIIALHLGSGASACAIKNGKSIDTTMGLTPLSGLPGATRSGDVDPSLIFHFTHDAGQPSPGSSKALHVTRAEEILNKESGWKALTGTTDFGVVSEKAAQGDEKAKLAFEVFVDRLVGYIGAYFVKLGGEVDALVFAGGIGEHGVDLRRAVVERVGCLGFEVDGGRNGGLKGEVVEDVGREDAKKRVLVCKTDEQAEMAEECAQNAEELRRPEGV